MFGIASLLTIGLAVSGISWLGTKASLELRIRDSVSKRWVWDLTMRIQDRGIRGYYQSESGDFLYRFTSLRPGASTLDISAPGYAPKSISLRLDRGHNALPETVELTGLGIPDLSQFFIFERFENGGIACELRPVGSTGMAVLNHPCMDLWIGCSVYVQLQDGAPALEAAEEGAVRGRELFRGEIPWSWDAAPETQFRYTAHIPFSSIKDDPSLYRIIDYLIVVPNPLAITRAELDGLMDRVFALGDPVAVATALEAEKDRLSFFMDTSLNVDARQE